MKPKRGDRIIIKNIPKDYPFTCRGLGTVDAIDAQNIFNVGFFTGYTPYKDDCFTVSGAGHSCPLDKLRFLKNDLADFWRFKNGIRLSHNGETYQEKVNYFEVDFNDIK